MLNSKQRAYLRKLAQTENAIFQIGKGGISENQINQIIEALEKRELVKITLLDTVEDDKNEIANQLAENTKSEIVHVLGRKITLYKQSSTKPTIALP